MVYLTKGTKITWIVILSILMLAVLGVIVSVFDRTVSGIRSNFVSSFHFPNERVSGAVGTTSTTYDKTYTVGGGQAFSLTIPLGKVTVVSLPNAHNVHLHANLQYRPWFGHAATAKEATWSTVSNQNGVNVALGFRGGSAQMQNAVVTLTVPNGVKLTVDDNLGDIEVNGGKFQSLSLHSNMGAIRATTNQVATALNLHNNMGLISYSGLLAPQSTMVDNMGSIQVNLTDKQPFSYHLTTNMGDASANVPSANLSAHGTSLDGSVPGQGKAAALSCTNNLGSITVQGE